MYRAGALAHQCIEHKSFSNCRRAIVSTQNELPGKKCSKWGSEKNKSFFGYILGHSFVTSRWTCLENFPSYPRPRGYVGAKFQPDRYGAIGCVHTGREYDINKLSTLRATLNPRLSSRPFQLLCSLRSSEGGLRSVHPEEATLG